MFELCYEPKKWRTILSRFEGSDVFHSWDYHAIHKVRGEGVPVLIFSEDGPLTPIAIPLLERNAPDSGGKELVSASYFAGPLFHPSYHFGRCWQQLVKDLKNREYVSLTSAFHPILIPQNEVNGTPVSEKFVLNAIHLKPSTEASKTKKRKESFCSKHIQDIHIEITQSHAALDDLQYLWAKADRSSARYCNELELWEGLLTAHDFGTYICIVKKAQRPIAGGLFVGKGDFLHYVLGGFHPNFQALSPLSLMLKEIHNWAKLREFEWLILGDDDEAILEDIPDVKQAKHTFPLHMKTEILNHAAYDEISTHHDGAIGVMTSKSMQQCLFPSYRGGC
ncbi:GNAT family N-acetyltransferase [Algicola sagamiensis]|uniref:GNAT family N-acetyltransferase n=1 Tax=Algicola sagamiensis TaxID=163869 RepID=UPI00035FAA01|nr:GNAT family N-acetyltransferase [Algicola sagamiensis]